MDFLRLVYGCGAGVPRRVSTGTYYAAPGRPGQPAVRPPELDQDWSVYGGQALADIEQMDRRGLWDSENPYYDSQYGFDIASWESAYAYAKRMNAAMEWRKEKRASELLKAFGRWLDLRSAGPPVGRGLDESKAFPGVDWTGARSYPIDPKTGKVRPVDIGKLLKMSDNTAVALLNKDGSLDFDTVGKWVNSLNIGIFVSFNKESIEGASFSVVGANTSILMPHYFGQTPYYDLGALTKQMGLILEDSLTYAQNREWTKIVRELGWGVTGEQDLPQYGVAGWGRESFALAFSAKVMGTGGTAKAGRLVDPGETPSSVDKAFDTFLKSLSDDD